MLRNSVYSTKFPVADGSSLRARSPGTRPPSKLGLQDTLTLGNLDAKRDWGYVVDYVEAMWMMLQRDEPDDFVIATGETNSVRRCVEIAFDHAGIHWESHVRLDDSLLRPAEVDLLVGDASKAERQLGWKPRRASSS